MKEPDMAETNTLINISPLTELHYLSIFTQKVLGELKNENDKSFIKDLKIPR